MIQYPYALDGNGQIRHIGERSPSPYSCVSCEEPMIARRGPINAHHFSHKVTQCDPDRALHDIAQALIMSAYTEAKEKGQRYYASFLCPRCKRNVKHNLVRSGRLIRKEKADLIKGTRPDLTLIEANGRPAALIEVVVTHDLEEGTRARYEELPISVFKTEPSWEGLEDEFQESFWAEPDSLNLPLCKECNATEDMRQEVDWFLEALTVSTDKPLPDSFLLPRSDYTERQKSWIRFLHAAGAYFPPRKGHLYLQRSKRKDWGLNFHPWYGDGKDGVRSVVLRMWMSPEMKRALKAEEGDLNYERVKTRIEEALPKIGEVEWWYDAD